MRSQIVRATSVLLRLPLWKSNRAADLEVFHFGGPRMTLDRNHHTVEVGDYTLSVQCPWRITRDDRIIVGNSDLYYPPKSEAEQPLVDFDWDRKINRRDELLRSVFDNTGKLTVSRVDVGDAGAVTISMDNNFKLDLFPNDSADDEYWRLFRPTIDAPHFVVSSSGVSCQ